MWIITITAAAAAAAGRSCCFYCSFFQDLVKVSLSLRANAIPVSLQLVWVRDGVGTEALDSG